VVIRCEGAICNKDFAYGIDMDKESFSQARKSMRAAIYIIHAPPIWTSATHPISSGHTCALWYADTSARPSGLTRMHAAFGCGLVSPKWQRNVEREGVADA